MEDGPLTSGPSSGKSLTEIFEELFPYFLSIGMTYKQFWEDDPSLAKYYREAHELSNRQRNQELWLQGIYICDAMNATVGNMLSKKSARKIQYPDKPYPITETELRQKQQAEKQEKIEKMKTAFMAKAMELNAKMSSETQEGGQQNE